MAIAAVAAWMVINITGPEEREARQELISHASVFLAPMVLMPFLGAWFLASMPPESHSPALGQSVSMTMLLGLDVAASLLIGAIALGAFWYRKFYINGVTSALLCTIAFVATAGGEIIHEELRAPFSIGQVLYSHSLSQGELERLRKTGAVTDDPYPLCDGLAYPNAQLEKGAKVYRFQCSACHSCDGVNGLPGVTGLSPSIKSG